MIARGYKMVDHISNMEIEAFCARAIKVSEMATMAKHLAACINCQQLFQQTLKKERGTSPISISLSPVDWFRYEHLDYHQMESLAEKRLDGEETAIVNLHLETCIVCREDVRSFLELGETLRQEPRKQHTPKQEPREQHTPKQEPREQHTPKQEPREQHTPDPIITKSEDLTPK